jgi:hypothetical protein
MDNLPEDQKVVDLLTKLKSSNGGYPSDMLAARRRTYLKQMANVGLGIGIGAGLKETLKGGGSGASAATTVTSKVLEIALIAAITVEAGTAAYLYRDKIANAIRSYISGPVAQEVTSPSDETSSNIPTSILIETIETPLVTTTPSGTPSGTPATSVAGSNNQNNNDGGANTGVNANATPNPNENQGNQYGLTPKPIRTTENNGGGGGNINGGGGGNDNGGGGGNNNKP